MEAITTCTKFGGHGGKEAMPEEKIKRDPWLKRMFLGYETVCRLLRCET